MKKERLKLFSYLISTEEQQLTAVVETSADNALVNKWYIGIKRFTS